MGKNTLDSVPAKLSPRGINVIILIAVFLALATVCLGLRFYTNWKIRKRFVLADWLVLTAYAFYYGHATVVILTCAVGGLGFHMDTLSNGYVVNNFKLGLGQQTAYALELGLIKVSLCLLFMQIFASNRRFKIVAWVVLVFCACWAVVTILIAFLNCHPLAFYWNPSLHGHCDNITAAWTAVGSLDVVSDTSILLLPIPLLWTLHMPLWKKFAVSGIFGLGIVTVAVGIARTITLSHVSLTDFTYTGYYAIVWSTIEPPIAITVVSCMALRPLFREKASDRISSIKEASRRWFGHSNSHTQSNNSDKSSSLDKFAHMEEQQRFSRDVASHHRSKDLVGAEAGRGMINLLDTQNREDEEV